MKSMMMKVKPIGLFSDALFVYWIGTFGENTTSAKKTLVICSSENAETTKIIKEWHEKVNEVLTKRGLSLTV